MARARPFPQWKPALFLVVLPLLLCLVQFALADGARPNTIQIDAQNVTTSKFIYSPGFSYVTSNFRTGSHLAVCIRRTIQAVEPRFQIQQGSMHIYGGLSAKAFHLNLVRNPFVLVDSAYAYHMRGWEPWVQTSFGNITQRLDDTQATLTFSTWNRWQPPASSVLSNRRPLLANETYGAVLRSRSLEEGLLLEAVRCLYRDIPFVLNSAQECKKVDAEASGRCTNVLLDDIMADYSSAFEHLVAPPLNAGRSDLGSQAKFEAMQAAFVTMCNVPAQEKKGLQGPQTSQEEVGKRARIKLLRSLDQELLGGMLAAAEKELEPLLTRPPVPAVPVRV
jgi:hypothetical protein